MPTYEYRCPNGHEFEKLQKMSEAPRAKCPTCGRVAARRISGGAGLVFKGSGFYITDYGKDGKGARKPDSAGSSDSSEGTSKDTAKEPAKSETKPKTEKKASE
jgi:putative FmdB family regulatory protein